MSRTRHTDKEKARILRDFEQHDQSAAVFCRQRGISYQTPMNWRRATVNLPINEQPPAFLEFELGVPLHPPVPAGTLTDELDALLPATWAAANRAAHPAIKSERPQAA
jgi:transposase-like protein